MKVLIFLSCFLFISVAFANVTQVSFDKTAINAGIRRLNILKCMHGQDSSQYYVWDSCLAKFAQNHANDMAKNTKMEHTTNDERSKICSLSNTAGENLYSAWGSAGAPSIQPTTSIESFYSEVVNYDFATGNCASNKVCGHFTSIIWNGATKVGFAASTNSDAKSVYFALNNGAPGATSPNMSGAYTSNLKAATRSEAECETIIPKDGNSALSFSLNAIIVVVIAVLVFIY